MQQMCLSKDNNPFFLLPPHSVQLQASSFPWGASVLSDLEKPRDDGEHQETVRNDQVAAPVRRALEDGGAHSLLPHDA